MGRLTVISDHATCADQVLPALGLLAHECRICPASLSELLLAPPTDVILLDATTDLVSARNLARTLASTGIDTPRIAVCTDGGLAGIGPDWELTDVVLQGAGPAEIEARLRLAVGRRGAAGAGQIRAGDLTIDDVTYVAKLRGRQLDLTFKEFELLKYLAAHPGRVFTRAQLVAEVWGYDFFGGTRTVDVHVRRLRAKLGPEHEHLIATIRNVGYKFDRDDEPGPVPVEVS